jgi:hypothetical protein
MRTTDPLPRAWDALRAQPGVRGSRIGYFFACCPAHDEQIPSLSVLLTEGGVTHLHCFGGCREIDVLHAVGCTPGDMYADTPARRRAQARGLSAILEVEQRFKLAACQKARDEEASPAS